MLPPQSPVPLPGLDFTQPSLPTVARSQGNIGIFKPADQQHPPPIAHVLVCTSICLQILCDVTTHAIDLSHTPPVKMPPRLTALSIPHVSLQSRAPCLSSATPQRSKIVFCPLLTTRRLTFLVFCTSAWFVGLSPIFLLNAYGER
jgi:hypothetical protein